MAFRADGKLLATLGSDNAIRLWDMTDPRHPLAAGAPLTGWSTSSPTAAGIRVMRVRDGLIVSSRDYGNRG